MTGVYLAFAAAFGAAFYMLGHRMASWGQQSRREEQGVVTQAELGQKLSVAWKQGYLTGRDVERRCPTPNLPDAPLDSLLYGNVPEMLRNEGLL